MRLFSGRENVSDFREGKVILKGCREDVRKKSNIEFDIKTIFFSDVSNVPLNLSNFPASFEHLLDILLMRLFSGCEDVSDLRRGKVIPEGRHEDA